MTAAVKALGCLGKWQLRRYALLELRWQDFKVWRLLIVVAVLFAGSLPSSAQRGPAFPSESSRGPAFPKSVAPTARNETNWVTSTQDNTPPDTYQQLWILQRRWDQLYGSPGWRAWRRGQ
jgi:hypothetical protein